MNKFKVGDKVRLVYKSGWIPEFVGYINDNKIFTIHKVRNYTYNIRPLCWKSKENWFFPENDFILVSLKPLILIDE